MNQERKISIREALGTGHFLKETGFSDRAVLVAQRAVRLGAREVLAIHGAPPEILQTVYKAADGATPRTVADLRSGARMQKVIRHTYPNEIINEEESGLHQGTNPRRWDIDPLDGTSSFADGQKYSTVGVSLSDEQGSLIMGAICNPFEGSLVVAQKDHGAFAFPLERNTLTIEGEGKRIKVSDKLTLTGGSIFVDALFNEKTTPRKLAFLQKMQELAGSSGCGIRAIGSNIEQQRQIAMGNGLLSLTDAVGGYYDLSAGAIILQEAGGKMVDALTGENVSPQTQVALGGPRHIIDQLLPIAQEIYKGYTGFR